MGALPAFVVGVQFIAPVPLRCRKRREHGSPACFCCRGAIYCARAIEMQETTGAREPCLLVKVTGGLR